MLAQNDNDCRLKALSFFCSNKNEIIKISNPILGEVCPIFLVDMNSKEDDELQLYIDSTQFRPDTNFIEDFLINPRTEYIANIKDKTPKYTQKDGIIKFSDFCDCIYLDPAIVWAMDSTPIVAESNCCKREFGLAISRVIYYKDSKYVVFRISSFFKAKVDKMQFCLVEFSTDGDIARCGIGQLWLVD